VAGDFLKHHFDDWLANSTSHDPDFSTPWAQKEARAVGRYTNFPTGRRAKSKRGQARVPPSSLVPLFTVARLCEHEHCQKHPCDIA